MHPDPAHDSLLPIQYAICRHPSDMRRGFRIETHYGGLEIEADEAGPFVRLLERVLARRLQAAERRLQAAHKFSNVATSRHLTQATAATPGGSAERLGFAEDAALIGAGYVPGALRLAPGPAPAGCAAPPAAPDQGLNVAAGPGATVRSVGARL